MMVGVEQSTVGASAAAYVRRFVSPGDFHDFTGVSADSEALRAECARVYRAAGVAVGAGRWSRHGLLRHRPSGEAVGAIELVGPQSPLPLYAWCEREGIDRTHLPPQHRTVEIARFVIAGDGAPHGAEGTGQVSSSIGERREAPHAALGLMALALQMSRQIGNDYLCAMLPLTVLRHLQRFGVHWQEIGPLIDESGLQMCIGDVDEMLATIAGERPDVWSYISDPRAGSPRAPGERFAA